MYKQQLIEDQIFFSQSNLRTFNKSLIYFKVYIEFK